MLAPKNNTRSGCKLARFHRKISEPYPWISTIPIRDYAGGIDISPLQSSTTYTIPPDSPEVDLYVHAPQAVVAGPDGKAQFTVEFGNHGKETAIIPSLTFWLPTGPFDANRIETYQNMPFLSQGRETFSFTVPAGTQPGTATLVQVQIDAREVDGHLADNSLTVNVLIATDHLFLPTISR